MIKSFDVKQSLYDNKFNILVILSIIFNILVFSNILGSDYFGDDLYNFQVPGLIPSDYTSITEYTVRDILGWMSTGRLFPMALYVYYLFDFFETLYMYKLFVLFMTITSIFLFSYLIYSMTKKKSLFLILLYLTPLLIQYRYYHDPMLSFHGLMQVLFIYFTLSLLFLLKYLQHSKKYYLYLSLLFFTFTLLTYEISYVFILMYIPVIMSQMKFKGNLKTFFFLLLPYFLVLLSLTIYTLYLRHNASISDGPYLPSFNVLLILKTYFYQVVSVIPATYFMMFEEHSDFLKRIENTHIVIIIFFIMVYAFTFSIQKEKNNTNIRYLLFLGILLLLLPGLLISFSTKFQGTLGEMNKVQFGLAYIPIYLQSFGLSLLLALFINKINLLKYKILIGLLLTGILAIHLVSNDNVIKQVNAPYKSERELLTSLFIGSFGSTLKDGSTIQFANESPLHRKDFLNLLTKKSLKVVIAPSSNYDFKIEYSISGDYALVHIEKHSSDKENLMIFKKSDTWREIFDDKNSYSQGIALPPFFNSFYTWEGGEGNFRWASNNANLLWINMEDKQQKVNMSFEMGSLTPRNITIKHNGKALDKFTITPGVPSPHEYTLALAPGQNKIEFVTPEPSVKPGGQDTRDITFSIGKFKQNVCK